VTAIVPTAAADNKAPEKGLAFHRSYLAGPVIILAASVVLVAAFYGGLPAEVAYRFEGGAATGWLGRGAFIAWTLIPQLVFAALGAVITGGMIAMSRRSQLAESPPVRKLLTIMGNMVALPQIVLLFAMLDIFLYNAYQIRLIPVWAFALVVMVGGGVALGVSLMQTLRQSRTTPGKTLQE
jgi:hypothetical protein